MKIKQIRPLEEDFTEVLGDIALTPKMLYYYGELPKCGVIGELGRSLDSLSGRNLGQAALSGPQREPRLLAETTRTLRPGRPPTVAIVGARKHTAYGEEVAYHAAYELAKRGVVIVSGLALGLDSVAHRGALAAGGCTVAVLGTAIDRIYPRSHVGLAQEIVERGGAVMSEYGPGESTHRANFLARNRLISALSDVVLVVEAGEKSGTLNTATHALEQGRDLWVVPGDITRPLSRGCNRLIAQGANPYTGVEDLIQRFFPAPARASRRGRQLALWGDNAAETEILRALAEGVREGEDLLARTGFSVAELNQTLMRLEIKGRVRGLGMNQWALNG